MPEAAPEPFAEEFTIVLLGSLNGAIFNPDWFARHELLGAEAAAAADVRVISPQQTDIDFGHFSLECDESRLTIRTTRPTHKELIFDLARGILRTLPHTPLKAAGINDDVHYRLQSQDQWHNIGHGLAPKAAVWNDVCEQPGMLKLAIQSPKSGWDYPLEENFVVEPYPQASKKHPAVIVRANTHFSIPPKANEKATSSADLAFEFLDAQWEAGIKRGRIVAAKIFEQYPV